jgi:hypothetical protein
VTESDAQPGAAVTWAHMILSALALLYVLAAPLSVFLSPDAVVPWYAGVAGLTCVSAVLVATTDRLGCLELFVPMVATISVIAFTAAQPDVIGLWIPIVQGAAVVALVLAYRWRRGTGRK